MTDTRWLPDLAQFPGPKYLSLTRALRDAIRAGELPPGSQLPTVRDLAWELHVTPGTVSRAYQLATQEGLLAATVGRGTFVAAQSPRLGPTQSLFLERDLDNEPWLVDLRSPQLPDAGRGAIFAQAMSRISEELNHSWDDYPTQRGEEPLRQAIVRWLGDRDLGRYGAEDIALTHGGQNALMLVFLCCLRGDRPVILTEDMAYPGIRHAARMGAQEQRGELGSVLHRQGQAGGLAQADRGVHKAGVA